MAVSPAAPERATSPVAAAVVWRTDSRVHLAEAVIEKFGGDSSEELVANWEAFGHTSARFPDR